jgi:glycosyltransferase involved in cell wall biosynthesis
VKISFQTNPGDVGKTQSGYGVVATAIQQSLLRLGHEITPDADIEFLFCQPQFHPDYRGKYRIAFLPWESTQLKPGWREKLNQCNEVWTPSSLIKQWFRIDGVRSPIFIYEHGLDPIWRKRKRRRPGDKIKFLHVGSPQPRKGAQMTFDAFRAAFDGRTDVERTIKCNQHTEVRHYDRRGSIIGTVDSGLNTALSKDIIDYAALPQFMANFDVLVYPSYGEGFGLIPLEAAATGMPVIITDEWAPYRDYLNKELFISTKLIDSPWPQIHPGSMLQPDFDVLVDTLRYVADNFAGVSARAYSAAPAIWNHYDWDKLTKEAFGQT